MFKKEWQVGTCVCVITVVHNTGTTTIEKKQPAAQPSSRPVVQNEESQWHNFGFYHN
jgi:hypothetical protein